MGRRWLVKKYILSYGPTGGNIMMKHLQDLRGYTLTKNQEEHCFPLHLALLTSHLCLQVSSP